MSYTRYALASFSQDALPWRRPAGEELDEGEVLDIAGVTFSDEDYRACKLDPRESKEYLHTILTEDWGNHLVGSKVIIDARDVYIEDKVTKI